MFSWINCKASLKSHIAWEIQWHTHDAVDAFDSVDADDADDAVDAVDADDSDVWSVNPEQ